MCLSRRFEIDPVPIAPYADTAENPKNKHGTRKGALYGLLSSLKSSCLGGLEVGKSLLGPSRPKPGPESPQSPEGLWSIRVGIKISRRLLASTLY